MTNYINKRNIRAFLLGAFATYGVLWAVLEPVSAFLPALIPEGPLGYTVFVVLAVIGGAYVARPARRVEFRIPGSDSRLEIRFGDIFESEGVVVIPVNEYFDGKLGDLVSEVSLHGQFIKDVLGGVSGSFFELTKGDLAGVASVETTTSKRSGQRVKYPIGTVVRADVNQRRYLLAALSHTDAGTLVAYATVQDLWTCLAGVWKGVREYSNGKQVSIPLLGSGLSRVGLPPGNLIEVIVTSFLCHTKERKVAAKVTLVLPSRLAGELDLNGVKRSWA